jgi:hypothetical protein
VADAQLQGLPTLPIVRDWVVSASNDSLDQPIRPVVSRAGTLFVADNADGTVSTYNQTGRRLIRAGSRGAGPGELMRFALGRGVVGDSAWFFNGIQLRLVVYGPNGRPARTVTLPASVPFSGTSGNLRSLTPLALLPDGGMIVRGYKPVLGDHGFPSGVSHVALVNRQGVATKTLGIVDDSLSSVSWSAARTSFAMPFGFRSLIGASADGAFVLLVQARHGRSVSDTVSVIAIRSNGDTAYSVRRVLPTTPVPKAHLERVRAERLASAARLGLEGELRDSFAARMPSTYPAVTDAVITREGRTWLRLQPAAGRVMYLTISPAGKPDGLVSLPQATTIVDAWGGRLWATERDDDGFNDIVHYRLTAGKP